MDLEQRVQALEQELEILKNQIQATLLDIQENVLTNTYPSLRADNSTMTHNAPGEKSGPSPIKTYKAPPVEDSEPHENDARFNPVGVRRVAFDNLQSVSRFDQDDEPAPVRQPDKAAKWHDTHELEEWVMTKMEKMGAERTRQLIFMYHENGRFSAEVVDTLLQLVDLYDGEASRPFERSQEHSSPPRKQRREMMPESTHAEPPRTRGNGRNTASHPKPTAADRKPKPNQPTANRAKTYDAVEANQPALVKHVPVWPSSERRSKASKPPIKRPDVIITNPAPQPVEEEIETVPEERATILRLIAGVYNAGIGGSKRSNK